MNYVNKLSVKSVYGAIKGVEADTAIMRVAGIAANAVHGESDKGPWTGFTGDFVGINLTTGDSYRATKAFVPRVASDQLEIALSQSEGPVEFAFDIYVRKAENVMGYEYFVKSVIETNKADPLAKLLAALPAMPAPVLTIAPPVAVAPSAPVRAPAAPVQNLKGKKVA